MENQKWLYGLLPLVDVGKLYALAWLESDQEIAGVLCVSWNFTNYRMWCHNDSIKD
jgi:hypothetical protein